MGRARRAVLSMILAAGLTAAAAEPSLAQAGPSAGCTAVNADVFNTTGFSGLSFVAGDMIIVDSAPDPTTLTVPGVYSDTAPFHMVSIPADGTYDLNFIAGGASPTWACIPFVAPPPPPPPPPPGPGPTPTPNAPTVNRAGQLGALLATVQSQTQQTAVQSAVSQAASSQLESSPGGSSGSGAASASLYGSMSPSSLSYYTGKNRNQVDAMMGPEYVSYWEGVRRDYHGPIDEPPLRFWASGDVRNINGGLDGHSGDVIVGADHQWGGNKLVGAFLAYSRTEVENLGIKADAESPAIGVYAARSFFGIAMIDGYLSYAAPRIEAGGGGARGNQLAGAVTLTAALPLPLGTATPYFRLGASDLSMPAYTNAAGPVPGQDVERIDASFGFRFTADEPLGGTYLRPHFSLSGGYAWTDSSVSGRSEYFVPRMGLGVSGDLGPGSLTLDLSGGKSSSDVYDVGVSLGWSTNF